MARTIQNQVPPHFEALYSPILRLKKLLMSKAKELEAEDFIQGFMLAHYSSFFMCNLYHQVSRDVTKLLDIRKLIETILESNQFNLCAQDMSKMISYIDNLGKELNLAPRPYLYIAMYTGYLDAEIYRHFHPTIGVYDFIESQYIHPQTVERMKDAHDTAVQILEESKLPIDKR